MAQASLKKGRLEDKVIVLSGAAQGIGRACVDAFVKEGAKVIATDLEVQSSRLKELEETYPGRVETHFVDVRNKSDIKRFGSQIGTCDALFNCAGVVHSDNIMDANDSNLENSLAINVWGVYWMSQEFLPKMIEKGGGSIINMSSTVSSIIGAPNRCTYGITKAAVIGLTKSVAADYIKKGIRCNCVCPGTVETESWRERVSSADDPIKAKQDFLNRQPMGRVGQPEEIASLIVHLASDESAYTTGSTFTVDGGWTNVHCNK